MPTYYPAFKMEQVEKEVLETKVVGFGSHLWPYEDLYRKTAITAYKILEGKVKNKFRSKDRCLAVGKEAFEEAKKETGFSGGYLVVLSDYD